MSNNEMFIAAAVIIRYAVTLTFLTESCFFSVSIPKRMHPQIPKSNSVFFVCIIDKDHQQKIHLYCSCRNIGFHNLSP